MDRDDDGVLNDTKADDTEVARPDLNPATHEAISSPRYKLGAVLGRGGMGEVLSARDEQLGRAVAIKRLRERASNDGVTRFLREARIQARLDHPAVVPVHELWDDGRGQPCFVMKQ